MKFEIKVRVFDPIRVIQTKRNPGKSLPKCLRFVQSFIKKIQNFFKGDLAARRCALVVNSEAANVHRRVAGFQIQERRVHTGELVHNFSLCWVAGKTGNVNGQWKNMLRSPLVSGSPLLTTHAEFRANSATKRVLLPAPRWQRQHGSLLLFLASENYTSLDFAGRHWL